jgi:glutamate-ammonia-ligase adenylyltransferase
MSEGRLYEVDMRLRPSGRQGPVATSLLSFQTYQQEEAWTWEHLALTRARAVAGPADLAADVASIVSEVLTQHAADTRIIPDLAEMRARLADAKQPQSAWDAKLGPGRMQDIELLAQAASLRAGGTAPATSAQIIAGREAGWFTQSEAEALTAAHDLAWQVQATARLLTGGVLDPDAIGAGGITMVLRETNAETLDALRASFESAANVADEVITAKLKQGAPS